MSHAIQALLVTTSCAAAAARDLPHTRPILIGQGIHLVPIVDATFDALRERFPNLKDPGEPEFWRLSGPVAHVAQALSALGPVAYIETDYFGGAGQQAAMVWDAGAVRMPPEQAESGSINIALRLMGVSRGSAHDEFDAVGLGACRNNEDWLARP